MEEISVSWFVVTVSSMCNGITSGMISMDDLKYFYIWERIRVRISVKSYFQFSEKAEGERKKVVKERKDHLRSLDCLRCCNCCVRCSEPLSRQFCEQCCRKKQALCLKTCFLLSLSCQVFDFTKNFLFTD